MSMAERERRSQSGVNSSRQIALAEAAIHNLDVCGRRRVIHALKIPKIRDNGVTNKRENVPPRRATFILYSAQGAIMVDQRGFRTYPNKRYDWNFETTLKRYIQYYRKRFLSLGGPSAFLSQYSDNTRRLFTSSVSPSLARFDFIPC